MFLHSKNKAQQKGYKGECLKVLRKCSAYSLILLWHTQKFENSKWLPCLARQKFLEKCGSYSAEIPCGLKILSKSLFLARFSNLISKLNFYKLIPYPMDNCFTGRRDWSRQTPEKDVLYTLPAGLVTECALSRWRIVLPSCLDIVTS